MLNLYDLMKEFIPDGRDDGKVMIFYYDDDHAAKMEEMATVDPKFYYEVDRRCGNNPYDDDEAKFGPDNDIKIININHFGIRSGLKPRVEELRKTVYDTIDAVYAEFKVKHP